MAKLSNDTCLIMWSKSNNDGIEMFLVPTRPCEQIYWHDFGDMVSLKYEVGVTLIRATSHMRLREPVTVTLRALSLVEKVELGPSSLHTTLEGQTEYGCKVYMGSKGSCLMNYFQKPPLRGRPNTKLGKHGTPNAHKCRFILFYKV